MHFLEWAELHFLPPLFQIPTQKPSHLSDALLLASHGDGGGGGDTFYTLLSSADYRLRWEINLLGGLFPLSPSFFPFLLALFML